MKAASYAKKYSEITNQTGVENADAHKLIQLLMQGALDKLATAKYMLQANNLSEKGNNISKAISIIDGLNASLDYNQGGEIAESLGKLYQYMMQALLEANLHNDINKIDEVINLLTPVKQAWDEIREKGAKANDTQ